jgi:hypothetical protein
MTAFQGVKPSKPAPLLNLIVRVKRRSMRAIRSAIWRIPVWLWLLLAVLAALATPHDVGMLELPDEPVFVAVRAAAWRQIVIQCAASAVFLALGIWRWAVGRKWGDKAAERERVGANKML